MRWRPSISAGMLLIAVAACGQDPAPAQSSEPPAPTGAPGETVTVDVADRPFRLHIPESYDPATPAPLVVRLHGFTSSSTEQEAYFQLGPESDQRGFLYALPEGTEDPDGEQFWNATDACCDFHRSEVDDAGYLRSLIETVSASYPVDASRVYLVGHSNGGFMAHRFACEHADVVTAIVSLAGAATNDPAECAPARPVSGLQVNGTTDTVIPFDGGANFGRPFPSVDGTLALWREHNGCAEEPETGEPLDLDSTIEGAETTVTSYLTGCRDGSRVELWTIEG